MASKDILSNEVRPHFDDKFPMGIGINTPDLDTSLKPKRRAITSVDQLNSIARTLEDAAKLRNQKNGRIAAKYDAERPYDQEKLKIEGLGWKNNFATKPLATAIDKIPPRLTRAVHNSRFLTSAALPDSIEGAKLKTEKFRNGITKLVRAWPGWRPFLNEVAAENATYGYTACAWLDKYSWKPTHFRQDRFFVPDQTKQTTSFTQIWIGRQEVQIFELVNLIDDPKAAEAAGWDLEAAVEAINEASPKSTLETSSPYTDFRTYEDAIRESSVYRSLQQGAKVVELLHFFVGEADGSVSYYLVNKRGSQKLLFQQLDLYPSMSEAITYFSYQQANGLLMGSKGIGRELYEIAGALDRARNEAVDRLMLAGKTWLRGSDKALERLRLSIVGNLVLLPQDYEYVEVKTTAGAEEFQMLDSTLTQLMDQIAGGVTPRQLQGERVTATQVNVFTSREEEKRDDITERFLLQVADVMTNCQRRICDPSTVDKDAVALRSELLRYMNEDDLKQLAEEPALRTVDDWTADEAQSIILFAQEKRNDPLYDQVKLAQKSTAARVNAEFAEDVVLPVNDPTQEAEQARMQTIENVVMAVGKALPISSRDNHRIHADVIKADLQQLAQALMQDHTLLPEVQLKLQHWKDHFDAALQSGAQADAWVEDKKLIDAVTAELGNLSQPEQPAQAGATEAPQAQGQAGQQLPQSPQGGMPAPVSSSPQIPQ